MIYSRLAKLRIENGCTLHSLTSQPFNNEIAKRITFSNRQLFTLDTVFLQFYPDYVNEKLEVHLCELFCPILWQQNYQKPPLARKKTEEKKNRNLFLRLRKREVHSFSLSKNTQLPIFITISA